MSILIDKNATCSSRNNWERWCFSLYKNESLRNKCSWWHFTRKAGELVDGVPVFNTVKDAVYETGANTSVIFVPAPFAKDAMMEAADAGISLIICITEGVPTLDVVEAHNFIKKKVQTFGPNCRD